jgi:hypothetical protein
MGTVGLGKGRDLPQVLVLGDRLLDAGLDLLEGGLVGRGEGGAVLVAGLFGLEGLALDVINNAQGGCTLRRRVRAALASFSRPL